MTKTLTLQEATLFGQVLASMPSVRLRKNVVWKMAANLQAINKACPDLDGKIGELFKEHGEPQEGPDPNYKKFLDAKVALMKAVVITVDLQCIRYDDLNIGDGQNDNHLPPHAVVALMPMISDCGEAQ
jgi:hypothetical protein